jgi:hydrogenase-4 membrane subunit HyfE
MVTKKEITQKENQNFIVSTILNVLFIVGVYLYGMGSVKPSWQIYTGVSIAIFAIIEFSLYLIFVVFRQQEYIEREKIV